MKPKFGGSIALFLTVLIASGFLTGGCGVGGGGGGGGQTFNTTPVSIPPDINVSANQFLVHPIKAYFVSCRARIFSLKNIRSLKP